MPLVNPDEQCDYKLDAHEVWIPRRRKSGEEFKLRLIVGDRCPNPAIVSQMRDGKRRHRCGKHLGASWQD